jgi:hypothetical protein
MNPGCTEQCENNINEQSHHWKTFINQRCSAMSPIKSPFVIKLKSFKLGSTSEMAPHQFETNVINNANQKTLASSFNNTRQQMKVCQIAISSFKIN